MATYNVHLTYRNKQTDVVTAEFDGPLSAYGFRLAQQLRDERHVFSFDFAIHDGRKGVVLIPASAVNSIHVSETDPAT